MHLCIRNPNGGIAQLARAPALQAGGRRFDSDYLHKSRQEAILDGFFRISSVCLQTDLQTDILGIKRKSMCLAESLCYRESLAIL